MLPRPLGLLSSLPIELSRGSVVQCLMIAVVVVESEVRADACSQCRRIGVVMEIDVFILQTSPQAFDEHVARARPRPSMLILMSAFTKGLRKISLVN